MPEYPDKIDPSMDPHHSTGLPAGSSNGRMHPSSNRCYELESGADIVLTFDVKNYVAFEQDAICDLDELAKLRLLHE